MSQLSAQSIESLCSPIGYEFNPHRWLSPTWWRAYLTGEELGLWEEVPQIPMIEGFVSTRQVQNGMSYGLSAASYDLRIAQDLCLQPAGRNGSCTLASTIERFCVPNTVCAQVFDKSSYARRFLFAMNTVIDPGFSGLTKAEAAAGKTLKDCADPYASLVLELVNLGEYPIEIKAGDPICQICFTWLDEATALPYRGKYAGQQNVQGVIFER